jgi:hypothetical protein
MFTREPSANLSEGKDSKKIMYQTIGKYLIVLISISMFLYRPHIWRIIILCDLIIVIVWYRHNTAYKNLHDTQEADDTISLPITQEENTDT